MTIGVIDECRRAGIGGELLKKIEERTEKEFPKCKVIYLHVIVSNEGAIRFY